MGQHTWFLKSKELYLKELDLYKKLDKFEENEIFLCDDEIREINAEIDNIENENRTNYHDVFRTNKRNIDNSYTDDVIFSKEECFHWINEPDNHVYFRNTVFDTDEQEQKNREYSLKLLNEFWDKYPNGVIYFC